MSQPRRHENEGRESFLLFLMNSYKSPDVLPEDLGPRGHWAIIQQAARAALSKLIGFAVLRGFFCF